MNELDEQNLKYWKAGLIYNNPNDPDIWVKKRTGLGWTMNFGHPHSYYVLGTFVLITAAVAVYSFIAEKG